MGDTVQSKEINKVRDHIGCDWSPNMQRKHLRSSNCLYIDHNLSILSAVGCPRNKQKFSLTREERKLNVFLLFFGLFRLV
jgi:hypothetical protein